MKNIYYNFFTIIFYFIINVNEDVNIDEDTEEELQPVGFKQYLKGKPHPWGTKAYISVDGTNRYLLNLCYIMVKISSLHGQTYHTQPEYS